MKKLFTSLLLMVLGVFLAHAVNHITVGGVTLNTDGVTTSTSITGSAISGTVTYYPNGGKPYLVLEDVTINRKGDCIFTNLPELNIYFKGTTKLTCNSESSNLSGCIYSQGKILLASYFYRDACSVTLNNEGAGSCIVVENNERLDITALNMKCTTANNHCIRATGTSSIFAPNFTWISLEAGGSGNHAIHLFKGGIYNYLNGLPQSVVTTSDCTFSSEQGGIVNSSGNLVASATVKPSLVVNRMPISMQDHSWTEASPEADALGLTKGKVSWDPSTKTLTFEDVDMNVGSNHAMYNNGIEDITIQHKGANVMKGSTSSGSIFSSYKNVKIVGEGVDLLKSIQMDNCFVGIIMYNDANLELNNSTIVITAEGWAVRGNSGTGLKDLTIKNSALLAKGETKETISGVSNCIMQSADVNTAFSPGICFRKALKGFGTVDGLTKEVVWIQPPTDSYKVEVLGNNQSQFDGRCD